MNLQFRGRSAVLVLVVLALCYAGYLDHKYSLARENIGQAKEAIVAQLKAFAVRGDLQSMGNSASVTDSERLAGAGRLAGDARIKLTSFECRGSLSGMIYFRAEYSVDGAAEGKQVQYFSMEYSLLLGWQTSELYPHKLGIEYSLSPWVISRGV